MSEEKIDNKFKYKTMSNANYLALKNQISKGKISFDDLDKKIDNDNIKIAEKNNKGMFDNFFSFFRKK